MPDKLVIEVRLNEYMSRRHTPHVPWTIDEIVQDALACHEAGAAVIHFHARTEQGRPDLGYEANAEIVRRIRERCDVLIHPTLGAAAHGGGAAERLAVVERMIAAGLPVDLVPLDFATTNVDSFDATSGAFRTRDRVYTNTVETLTYFAGRLRELGVRAYPVAWNLVALRYLLAFHQAGLMDGPKFVQLMVSAPPHIFAHPDTLQGLRAYTDFLPETFAWNVYNMGGSIFPLLDHIIDAGGNVAAGLGDHPYVEEGRPTNAELVRRIAERARARGRQIASPAEARVRYGIGSAAPAPAH
ncbi:MAG: 3-keto-5-aminohexanoate cleavage protein [Phenylobacterium sp.]